MGKESSIEPFNPPYHHMNHLALLVQVMAQLSANCPLSPPTQPGINQWKQILPQKPLHGSINFFG